jgi:methylated-DNA-[protein]-cysteine S-methyltransferase
LHDFTHLQSQFMDHSLSHGRLTVFQTDLGWMAVLCHDQLLQRVTFGHKSASAAEAAIAADAGELAFQAAYNACWHDALVAALTEFAAGARVDFSDVRVDDRHWTPFQRKVRAACRRIPLGETRTYAELAATVGSPKAARAVGRVMATNPVPIVIPCHRVVGSGGGLGGFSAIGGLATKRKLLTLERGTSDETASAGKNTRHAPRATRHASRSARHSSATSAV